jgi:hypothetical protein
MQNSIPYPHIVGLHCPGVMKAHDIFGLAVRIIGVVFVYQGLSSVPNAVNSICPAFPHFLLRNIFPSLMLVGWPLLIGYWLIRGAPWLMRLAYGKAEGSTVATAARSPTGMKPFLE